MKKKVLWTAIILLTLATAWRLSWLRFLPVIAMHGDYLPRESFEEMVNRAELIVLADVKSVKQGPHWVVPSGHPGESVHRGLTQRIKLEVVKVYKGDVVQGQTVTLQQWEVGITRFYQFPFPAFQINENDPVYKRGERYLLMLIRVFMP